MIEKNKGKNTLKTAMETFNTKAAVIAHLLEMQAQLARISGEQVARQRHLNSERFDVLLYDLERFSAAQGLLPHTEGLISALRARKWSLPPCPQWRIIKQIQQILVFPNLLLLTYEETPVKGLEIPEIARLVAVDRTGTRLFDHPLLSEKDRLSAQGGDGQPPCQDRPLESAQVWSELLSVVTGRYTLCDNLFLLQLLLIDTAKRLDLEPPILVGQSIFQLLLSYFDERSDETISDFDKPSEEKLASTYERLGITLPRQPHATPLEQATAQLQLLQAMAQGTTSSYISRPLRTEGRSLRKSVARERKH